MIQKLALAFGILFMLIGILGFIPALLSSGLLFGAFTVGTVHNAGYLVAGVLALLAAWLSGMYPLMYFKVFGTLFALATIIGFVQGDSILGLIAVNMADNFLHLVIAAVTLWAGFGAKPEAIPQQQVVM